MKVTPITAPDTAPVAGPSAPSFKRAVKKTAAKQAKKKSASAPLFTQEQLPEPIVITPVPAPAAVKEELKAERSAPAVPRRPATEKTVAKKAVRGKIAIPEDAPKPVPAPRVSTPVAPPAPALETPAASIPAAKKTARKTVSRKTAAPITKPDTAELFDSVPVSAPQAEKDSGPEIAAEKPVIIQAGLAENPVSPDAPYQSGTSTAPAADDSGFQPGQPPPRFPENREAPGPGGYPPRHARPARPPFPAPQSHSQPPPQDRERPRPDGGFQDSDMGVGPDGLPRRLNKWERWKLRKEKFKLQKQQRFLERQGGPGPEPRGPQEPPAQGYRPQEASPPPFRERERPQYQERPSYQERPQRPERIERPEPQLGPPEETAGLLEITGKGFAFLRSQERNFASIPTDPFVSPELIRQYGLREGMWIEGIHRRSPRGSQITEITKVNGLSPEACRTLPLFEELTAINPNKRYILETVPTRYTTRLIDFIAPIGRGQRGLIVAPPRAGKTTFLEHIAEAILENYKGVKVIVLLVDERPEEVTEITRALPGAEIMASSNDQDPRNHIRMAHLAVERAKRLVEAGEHVFMLLDSITRLARGFNNSMRGGGGKAMSGGIDSRALEAPRKLFAAARNTREAGSLTIMATALVETNNKGDDLIFQEFKGTGNMELVLDRKIAQQYVYPAVDIFKSGTRREELLLPPHQLEKIHLIRRGLAGHRPVEAMERLLQFMQKFPNNAQMLIEIKSRE